MIETSELDRLILSFALPEWRKVAMIVAKTLHTLEGKQTQITVDEIGARVKALVESGQLDAQGDVTNWRHGEVRLRPPSP